MAMGMFAVDDMAGIDVAIRAQRGAQSLLQPRRAASARRRRRSSTPAASGRRPGKGWYVYGDDRKPKPDPDGARPDSREGARRRHPQRTFTNEEIVERAIYALINEGARVLEDGLVMRASDIDTIYVTGYGFPAWRGGPMFYADRVGLGAIYERIASFQREYGPRWTPAPLLERLAREGGTFRALDRRCNGRDTLPPDRRLSGSATRRCCLRTCIVGRDPDGTHPGSVSARARPVS